MIDKKSPTPIYEQIIKEINREILADELKAGDMLPSVRELALSISTNPNTVQKAFSELEGQGLAKSSPGIGRYVSENAKEKLQGILKGRINELEELLSALKNGGISHEDVDKVVKSVYGTSRSSRRDSSLAWLD